MAPQSRGIPVPSGLQSKSTPNLPTLNPLSVSPPKLPQRTNTAADPVLPNALSPTSPTSPSEPASAESNTGATDEIDDIFSLEPGSSSSSKSNSDVEGEEEENDDVPSPDVHISSRPLYKHASRSYTHLPPAPTHGLFPPFYNRPPTPLPPSPSLTSLLIRPSRSAQTSRPTTPDDSSDPEHPSSRRYHHSRTSTAGTTATSANTGTGTTTPALPSALTAPPDIPRATPRVPTYEYYGFALYLFSSLFFLMYLLWAYLPSPFLHQLGIDYYPNRWWALAIPAWLVVLVGYIYVALASYNTGYLTLGMARVENLVDEAGRIAVVDRFGRIVRGGAGGVEGRGKGGRKGHARQASGGRWSTTVGLGAPEELDWKSLWSEGTDAVMDVPIGGVCEILYGEGRAD
ncbi:hypothetical protein H2201_005384 [Coniosporium apollinis]|uniref:PIG-P domain-containing protein n=1 Tax=Coniosporium apollinis TaxID=61459 RepID=A0ABQ9NT14_9PEZI|nr:hypothetical protein H2201_005384 [Coniosporium apollinis]